MNRLYYLDQTKKAIDNFGLNYHQVDMLLIYSIVEVKIAAAKANYSSKRISKDIRDAIIRASEDILKGTFDDQFITCAIQGGAGTSINMNVNEVIASRASEIVGYKVHPNDEINCGQSTNDVNPTAFRIVCYRLIDLLIKELMILVSTLKLKAQATMDITKVARTHMQDAVPITLGDEFLAYSSIIQKHLVLIGETKKILNKVNIGGTAVGNGINTTKVYRKKIVKLLSKQVGIDLVCAENLMAATSSGTDFVHIQDLITNLFVDLSKIATDLRFLSSGPKAGISEIHLEPRQSGSSIMPGKVNPVIPELVNQVYYFIVGKDVTVKYAAEQASLELCLMFPVIADSIISSLKLAISAIPKFSECIRTIKADKVVCGNNFEKSYVYSTLFINKLGYDRTSELVKEANENGKSLKETMVHRKILTSSEFDKIISQAKS